MAQQIGQMNGGWAVLLKMALATYPIVIGWAGWATVELIQITADEFRSSRIAFESRIVPIEQFVYGAQILPKAELKFREVEERLGVLERGKR